MTREGKQDKKTIGVGSLIARWRVMRARGSKHRRRHRELSGGGPYGAGRCSADAVRSLPNFAELAKRLGPSVVNVSTTQVRRMTQGAPAPFGQDDPRNDLLERFFGGRIPRVRNPDRNRARVASARDSSLTITVPSSPTIT